MQHHILLLLISLFTSMNYIKGKMFPSEVSLANEYSIFVDQTAAHAAFEAFKLDMQEIDKKYPAIKIEGPFDNFNEGPLKFIRDNAFILSGDLNSIVNALDKKSIETFINIESRLFDAIEEYLRTQSFEEEQTLEYILAQPAAEKLKADIDACYKELKALLSKVVFEDTYRGMHSVLDIRSGLIEESIMPTIKLAEPALTEYAVAFKKHHKPLLVRKISEKAKGRAIKNLQALKGLVKIMALYIGSFDFQCEAKSVIYAFADCMKEDEFLNEFAFSKKNDAKRPPFSFKYFSKKMQELVLRLETAFHVAIAVEGEAFELSSL